MGKYIVYRLDGTGRIRGSEWLDALDDRFALQGAQTLAGPGGCEVWQLDRRVGRVCPEAFYPASSRCSSRSNTAG